MDSETFEAFCLILSPEVTEMIDNMLWKMYRAEHKLSRVGLEDVLGHNHRGGIIINYCGNKFTLSWTICENCEKMLQPYIYNWSIDDTFIPVAENVKTICQGRCANVEFFVRGN